MHVAVIHYLYKRHWSDGDEALLGISVSLLASVLEQKNSIRPSEKHTSESVNQILKLPFLASVDTDVMLDVFTIICFYLQDKNFVLEIVETKQIDIVWQLVVYTEGIMQQGVAEDTELDEDDQKQCKLIASLPFTAHVEVIHGLMRCTSLSLWAEGRTSSSRRNHLVSR